MPKRQKINKKQIIKRQQEEGSQHLQVAEVRMEHPKSELPAPCTVNELKKKRLHTHTHVAIHRFCKSILLFPLSANLQDVEIHLALKSQRKT